MSIPFVPALLGLAVLGAAAATAPTDDADRATLGAMRAELERSSRKLRLAQRSPPYFVSYWVVDASQQDTQATLGALVASSYSQSRRVRAEVRVGSPEFDNSNFLGSGLGGFEPAPHGLSQAPQDDPAALRHVLWLATDAAYKGAVETLEQKRAARESEMGSDDLPSFSKAPPTTLTEPRRAAAAPTPGHEDFVRRVSRVFRRFPEVQRSWVHLVVSSERRYFVSTEGSTAVFGTPYSEVEIVAEAQAPDGMSLERSIRIPIVATEPPPEKDATAAAERLAEELTALRNAPLLEDYSGPVLFEGLAAAQIAHDLLSESLSGSPAPRGAEGLESPLARKLGKRVLPKTFSVFDDPTLTSYRGHQLVGYYATDDEGVVPSRVSLVEDGRLKSFLMSRMPRKEIPGTNGHGRSGLSGWARGRAGNLIVEARGGLTRAALRRRLLRVAAEEGLDEALVVTALEPRPGASTGQVVAPPQMIYRLRQDGTEELVRTADIGTLSIRDLRDIVATGHETTAYHYAMPTGSGFALPTSVVAPDLLFEDVELRRPSEPNKRPPVLPPPPPPAQGSLQQRKPVE